MSKTKDSIVNKKVANKQDKEKAERRKKFWRHVGTAFAGIALAAVLLTPKVVEKLNPKHEKGTITAEMRESPKLWAKAEKDASVLLTELKEDNVTAIGVASNSVLVETKDKQRYFVQDSNGKLAGIISPLIVDKPDSNIELAMMPTVKVGHEPSVVSLGSILLRFGGIFGILAILLIYIYFAHPEKFKRNKLVEVKPDETFDDVIGAREAKSALLDIVNYLKDSERFDTLGAKPPRGVLLLGGPGVGKTLLAKALAGESGANFYSISGSHFSSSFYGAGISAVKRTFALARKHAPCILFIDEIDGIAKRTSKGSGPEESEVNRIINQILVEMDGFENNNEGIVVVGATNLASNLDEALLREGRFDRRVTVGLPDVSDREAILDLYAKKVKTSPTLDLGIIARMTTGLAPSALAYLINHAALIAAKKGLNEVTDAEIMEAVEVTQLGEPSIASRALNKGQTHRIAVHEAGHALVSAALESGKVEKVSILPRGGALGVTFITQAEDSVLVTKSELEDNIKVLLGGRCAEELLLGQASSGAAHDLQEASRLALNMVTQYGFNSKLSLFNSAGLPAELAVEHVKAEISEADKILSHLHASTAQLLITLKPALEELTAKLLAEETVSGEVVRELIDALKLKAEIVDIKGNYLVA